MIQRSGGFTYTNYYIVASTGDHSDGMIMTLLSICSNFNEQREKFCLSDGKIGIYGGRTRGRRSRLGFAAGEAITSSRGGGGGEEGGAIWGPPVDY